MTPQSKSPGQSIASRTYGPVNAEKMKTVAVILEDGNPIHWDLDAVKAHGLGDRVINQGPINLAYLIDAVVHSLGDPGAIRSVSARFTGVVREGDLVACAGQLVLDDATRRCYQMEARTESGPAVVGQVCAEPASDRE